MPPAQSASPHAVPAGAKLHCVALTPSHCPPHGGVPWHGGRLPCGGPAGATVQVPTEPVEPQASHCPSQTLSQHTPSTQKPDEHASFTLHGAPFAPIARHTPEEVQNAAGSQSAPVAQLVPHAEPAQRKGVHATGGGTVQAALLPVHAAAAVAAPAEQVAAAHSVPATTSVSLGQSSKPAQVSSTSQGPADDLHTTEVGW
jgi:hypothetical protein